MDLNNKKVLLVGLGILGGGVATAKWLCNKGVKLSITDLKSAEYLDSSISQLSDFEIKYFLEGHDGINLEEFDFVVLNPDVPFDSPFVEEIKKQNIPIENELTLFQKFLKTKKLIAITGTRGKTTTVAWTAFLMNKIIGKTFLAGNSPDNPFLKIVDEATENDFVVCEVPSYQLEVIGSDFHPKVSVITNIYRDHINRHYDEDNYAQIKANIYKGQSSDDFVILNKNNSWTDKFIREGIVPQAILIPDESLLPELPDNFGEHNKMNLTVAASVVKIFGGDVSEISQYIKELPQIKIRQEKIYEDENLLVINDSAATSPEATIAAVERFKSDELVLITGGTDKGLYYEKLGECLNKNISNERLILLSGSATEKLKENLKFENLNEFDSLEECLEYAKEVTSHKSQATIVFSPGAKSFEKFKNEFDRGEKFNQQVKEVFDLK